MSRNGHKAAMHSSVESMLRNQEENGAFVASPDFAEYHYCWFATARSSHTHSTR